MRAVALPSSEELFNEKEGERAASLPPFLPNDRLFKAQEPNSTTLKLAFCGFFSYHFLFAVASQKLVFVLCWAGGIWGLEREMLPECEWLRARRKAGLHAALHMNTTCFCTLSLLWLRKSD